MVHALLVRNIMKTLFITAALSAFSFISVNGQEVARFSDFGIVPSTLTSNGKATAVGFNEKEGTHTANILDDNLKTVRQFNLKTESRMSRDYMEIATVKPSGAEINTCDMQEDIGDGETHTATDLNSMIQTLSNIHDGYNFYGFTDLKGRLSCWSPELSPFYNDRWFGTMYPVVYFAIVDGVINRMYVNYQPTFSQSDIDNAQWEYADGDETPSSYTVTAEGIELYDYDTNIYFDTDMYITQTLFNDDDKWEYVLPLYGQLKKTVGDYWTWSENENGMILRRNATESQAQTGWAIYNEDGNKIASLESAGYFDYVYKFAGNIYILTYEDGNDVVYKYDPKLTSIEEVSRSKSKAYVVKVNGHSFRVDTDGQNVDEAVLVDMAGRKVASSRSMDGESLTINATNMPKGVYNVALKNKGKVAGAQKIIIR